MRIYICSAELSHDFRNNSKVSKEAPSWMKESEKAVPKKEAADVAPSSAKHQKLLSNLPPKNMLQKRWISSTSR